MDGLLEDLFEAYFKARKNKRNKKDQLAFEVGFESKLVLLYEQIVQRSFKPENYTAFVSKAPVIREVFAPSFRDRVVHHLLFRYLSEIFEPLFIADSYSCRVGKGTLYGIRRVQDMIYSCSHGYQTSCYVLKLDISGYFYSIDKNRLYTMCENRMKECLDTQKYQLVDFLLRVILFDDVVSGAVRTGSSKNWALLPPSRSLFYTGKDRGLPIGNLTSQLFSNIYMHLFDVYMVRDLGLKYYGRYVDDFVVVHRDRQFLQKMIKTSALFLKQHLGLTLHPRKIYLQHYTKGVGFLGAFIKPHRVYVGRRIKGNFYTFIYTLQALFNGKQEEIKAKQLQEVLATMNSYLGLLGQFHTYALRQRALGVLPVLFYDYFKVDVHLRSIRLCKK